MHWRSSGGQGGYAAFIAGITEAKGGVPVPAGAMAGPPASQIQQGYRAHRGHINLYRKEPHFKNPTQYIYTYIYIYNILKAKLPNGRPLLFCFGRWCCSCNGSRCLSWHLTLLIQEDTGRSPPLVIEKSMVHNSEGLLTLKGKCMHKWVVGFRLT